MTAKPTKRESTSPLETVYSGAAPVGRRDVLIAVPASDTTKDPVVVVDAVVVSDEVDVAVVVAETVGAEPADPGAALVAFAEIGGIAAAEESKADASERADDAAGGSALASEIAADAADESSERSDDATDEIGEVTIAPP